MCVITLYSVTHIQAAQSQTAVCQLGQYRQSLIYQSLQADFSALIIRWLIRLKGRQGVLDNETGLGTVARQIQSP